jgi:hypothetical protein
MEPVVRLTHELVFCQVRTTRSGYEQYDTLTEVGKCKGCIAEKAEQYLMYVHQNDARYVTEAQVVKALRERSDQVETFVITQNISQHSLRMVVCKVQLVNKYSRSQLQQIIKDNYAT